MFTRIPTHSWLKRLSISYVPGPSTPLAKRVAGSLMDCLRKNGHDTQAVPSEETDIILTTARLGEPLGWREALLFTARKRFGLKRTPIVFTIVHALPEQLSEWMLRIERILSDGAEALSGFRGIPATAARTLYQQGQRGGTIMYLLRLVQIQTKSIRALLVTGRDQPESAFLFDLVGAHPHIRFEQADAFYEDIATRIVTAASTREITDHRTVRPPVKQDVWRDLPSIRDMLQASQELGRRDFFTEMIHVSKVAEIPGFSDAISQQYSEGCFATWEPRIAGLVSTITGSARPVQKDNISDGDLAVIMGVKPEGDGALIRKVEGHPSHAPSSEAVEMFGIDLPLPKISLQNGAQVPVMRSKLHGHRGVRSFDPSYVEYVSLPESYLHYPVSCSTDAQYHAVQEAFSRSTALQNTADPRQLVFTVLPGHGLIIVEKWIEGKQAFQAIWEAMDNKLIEISNHIPQGPFRFETTGGRAVLTGSASLIGIEHTQTNE